MKKKALAILVLTVGLMVFAGSTFATGDLSLTGNLAVGQAESGYAKTHIQSDMDKPALHLKAFSSGSGNAVTSIVGQVYLTGDMTDSYSGKTSGQLYQVLMQPDIATSLERQNMFGTELNIIFKGNDSVNTQAGRAIGMLTEFQFHDSTSMDMDSVTGYELRWSGNAQNATMDIDSYKGVSIGTPDSARVNAIDWYQMYIEKAVDGINNYGIVLNGNGAVGDYGAALVLGAGQNAFVYGKTDGVYVYDGIAETKISPHDPESGDWIFYSKNIKTGRTVRVNMEELVRDMEKLTGKKYLIESFVTEK